MAEKEDKRSTGPAEAMRSAAMQALQATAGQAGLTRERAQELADELAHAAGRLRDAIDELRPATADELRSLREELGALEQRVAALEAAAAPAKATASRRAPRTST